MYTKNNTDDFHKMVSTTQTKSKILVCPNCNYKNRIEYTGRFNANWYYCHFCHFSLSSTEQHSLAKKKKSGTKKTNNMKKRVDDWISNKMEKRDKNKKNRIRKRKNKRQDSNRFTDE